MGQHTPEAKITLLTASSGQLVKRATLDDAGKIKLFPAPLMYRGNARVIEVATPEDLNHTLDGLSQTQAISTGVLRGVDFAEITTKHKAQGNVLSRSKEHFTFQSGKGWLLWDYDAKTMPADVTARVEDLGGPLEAFFEIWPEARSGAYLIRRSSSDGIKAPNGAEKRSESLHGYFLVDDVSRCKEALETLQARAWTAGLAWIALSESGAKLERSIVDVAVGSPERLIFEAPPILENGLTQTRPAAVVNAGEVLSIPQSEGLFNVARAYKIRAEAEIHGDALEQEAKWTDRRAVDLAQRLTISYADARAQVVAWTRGKILQETDVLQTAQGTWVSVKDILDNASQWDRKGIPDPIEGIAYGADKATLLLSPRKGHPNDKPAILSHAHGQRTVYRFARYEQQAQAASTPLPKKLPFLEGKAALEKAIKDTLQRPEGDTLITAPLGLGKSYATARAVVERIAAYRQAGDMSAAAEVLVPMHKNSVEWEEALLDVAAEVAPAITVAVVYGPEAKDPATGKPICHRPEERREQAALLLNGCKGCPFAQECKSYQSKQAHADIYIRAHAALSNKPVPDTKLPNNKSRNQYAAFVVIDEDHIDGRIVAGRTVPVAALCAAPCGDAPKDGTSPLSDRRDALYRIVKANGQGPLRREVIMSNWIERTMRSADTIAADAIATAKLEYARKIKDPNAPEIEHNRSVMGGVAVWKQLAEFLRTGKDVAHRMKVEICPEKGPCLKLSYVKPLDDAYKPAPKLMLDATADPDLLEIALGERPAVRSIEVATPNLTVRQDWTRHGGKSQLLERKKPNPSADKSARSWQRKIVAYICREAAKVDHYGLITYKDLLEQIADQLPANVKTAHFGALRGLNYMKDCNAAVIIGRPLPSTAALQSMYIAMTGDEPPATIKVPVARKVAVEGGYSVIEGNTVTSEDPIMRKIIGKIRDNEVLQAVGRVRAIQRLDVPITVTVLSDAVLPDPVEPCAVWDEIKKPDPIQRQLDQGGVAFLAAGHAAQAYPALWSLEAAKKVWSRDMPAVKGTSLIEALSISNVPLTRIVYRAVNGRKDMTALVDATTVDKAREMLLAVMPDARIIEIEPPMPEVPAEYEAEGIVYINQARCIALSWPIEVLGDTGGLWLDVASMGKPHLIPPDDMRKIIS